MNRRRLKKIFKYLDLATGISGSPIPDSMCTKNTRGILRRGLTRKEQDFVKKHKLLEEMKQLKHDSYRNACLDVLGEDPDDWGLTYQEYCEKYGEEPGGSSVYR